MKRQLFLLACTCLPVIFFGQSVGIGTTSPAASARLDISASDKGVLIPRISLTNQFNLSPVTGGSAEGLLVYNSNEAFTGQGGSGKGFFYWTGNRWQKLVGGLEGWNLNGNMVDTAVHFLGTINNAGLVFKASNFKIGGIFPSSYNTFLGRSAGALVKPNGDFDAGMYNTLVGADAGVKMILGQLNTFLGARSGINNLDGSFNTFIGYQTGAGNTTGNFNTAIGLGAGGQSTGSGNISIGYSAGGNLGDSKENVLIGSNTASYLASPDAPIYGNVFIGNNAGPGSFSIFIKQMSLNNTIVGDSAAYFNLNGAVGNVFMGKRSGLNSNTGDFNVFVGDSSGLSNSSGSQNTFVGSKAQGGAGTLVNATAIGSNAQVNANNALVLGSVAGVNGAVNNVNVGIGTNNPQRKLHIVDEAAAGINSNANSSLVLEKNGTANYINFLNTTAESGILFGVAGAPGGAANGGILYNNPSFAQGLMFRTGGNANRMVIDNLGNVGIGTSAPVQKLEVLGNTRITGELYQGALNANMMPVCYGNILASGTIQASTGNIQSVTKVSTGVYDILITGQSYTTSAFIVQITTTGSVARLASSTASGSALRITIFDAAGAVADGAFHFVVYKP
jgi:hypothetical protein